MQAQIPFDTLFSKPGSILSDIPPGITDIEADEEGNLYLLETRRHKLHKRFARTGLDSMLTVGGKGSGEEGFNLPAKICVPNRQNLYLLDLMNRRVAVLNTNLRVVEDINFLDIDLNLLDENLDYLNPISFTAGPSGELYVLNQEDLKIYKIYNDGRVQTTFGGLDYGPGSLLTPDDVCINRENYIFVSDTATQTFTVFDLFGIYQYKLQPPASFRWKRIVCYENYLICLGEHALLFLNLTTQKTHEQQFPGLQLTDIAGTRDKFFLLTTTGVQVYGMK